ncbi:MAG: ABC transporter ATP-binding protein [Prolixibacteraceae bacterium]|nr:ABC transporter ATP-binding protein [Prolixibacteraceae bacterium]
MSLQVKGLKKEFDSITVFRDFNIAFPESSITCILGPSGCGKTTLLNILGKIIQPTDGELTGFDGKNFSYIFQEPRLLPWKTVEGNIEFVISREIPAKERKEITGQFIQLVELDAFADFYPHKLSGGMRQRVSIARAFAYPSDIILMDEPLKGLDVALKQNLIRAFSRIWQTDRRTVIFVTHDVDEALLLGNEIVVFSKAPVDIKLRQKVDLPLASRSLESDNLKKLKRALLRELG